MCVFARNLVGGGRGSANCNCVLGRQSAPPYMYNRSKSESRRVVRAVSIDLKNVSMFTTQPSRGHPPLLALVVPPRPHRPPFVAANHTRDGTSAQLYLVKVLVGEKELHLID